MDTESNLNRDIPVLDWSPYLSERAQGMTSSVIRELLKLTQEPDIISFAGGLPAPELFPLREIDKGSSIQRHRGTSASQGLSVRCNAQVWCARRSREHPVD